MIDTIDPYLTSEDVRLISGGLTDRFVDVECHEPDSVLMVRGVLYYIQSATAVHVRDLPPKFADLGYERPRQVSAAIQDKFPHAGYGTTVYIHRIIKCRCYNCKHLDGCGRYIPEGMCENWERGFR